jgi:hypothetical protein
MTVAAARLGVIGCAKAIADRQFEIESLDSRVQAFDFTFG